MVDFNYYFEWDEASRAKAWEARVAFNDFCDNITERGKKHLKTLPDDFETLTQILDKIVENHPANMHNYKFFKSLSDNVQRKDALTQYINGLGDFISCDIPLNNSSAGSISDGELQALYERHAPNDTTSQHGDKMGEESKGRVERLAGTSEKVRGSSSNVSVILNEFLDGAISTVNDHYLANKIQEAPNSWVLSQGRFSGIDNHLRRFTL